MNFFTAVNATPKPSIATSLNVIETDLFFHIDPTLSESYTSGSIINDVKGNETCTLTNGAYVDSNNDIVFDGVNDSLVTSLTDNTNFQNTFTIEVWVNTQPPGTNYFRMWDKSAGTSVVGGFSIYIQWTGSTNKIYNAITGTLINTSSATYSANTWTRLSVVYSSAYVKVYKNGSQIKYLTHSQSLSGVNTSNPFVLGNVNGNNRPLKGKIGMASIYNRELSGSEILSNYNTTKERYGL
jgi:hypothetical protein